jgi:sugar phosphate isomerase/epimerase
MKVSFSTLGCPEWSWDDMVATAKDAGFDGIEIRGIENELFVPNAKPFLESNLQSTKDRLKKIKLEIPCLTSACYLYDKENIFTYLKEGKEYIDLAQRLEVPYIRVLGDRNPEPDPETDFDFVAENLSKLSEYAHQRKIKLLIETNGIFSDSGLMLSLVNKLGSERIGVLWDIHHPYRFMNEPVEKAYNTLKEYIKFVHIKDSIIENGKIKYKMMGCGDVPVKEAILLLKRNSYEGFISLEWVKRWCIDLEDPGIVFSHFINFVKDIID